MNGAKRAGALMAAEVIGQEVSHKVAVVFRVREGTASPYQGVLHYTAAEFPALTARQIETAQLAQFDTWKAAQVPPAEPTLQELERMLAGVRLELTLLAAREVELVALIEDAG
jgi:hypothetical protein